MFWARHIASDTPLHNFTYISWARHIASDTPLHKFTYKSWARHIASDTLLHNFTYISWARHIASDTLLHKFTYISWARHVASDTLLHKFTYISLARHVASDTLLHKFTYISCTRHVTTCTLLTVRNRNRQLKLEGEPSPFYLYPSFLSTFQLSLSHPPLPTQFRSVRPQRLIKSHIIHITKMSQNKTKSGLPPMCEYLKTTCFSVKTAKDTACPITI